MNLGYPIGKVEKTGRPLSSLTKDDVRFQAGRLLQETAISGVLAGAGRIAVRQGNTNEGQLFDDVYARPPIESFEEAQRLGQEVTKLLDRAQQMFPHSPLQAEELDTFIPAKPEQNE